MYSQKILKLGSRLITVALLIMLSQGGGLIGHAAIGSGSLLSSVPAVPSSLGNSTVVSQNREGVEDIIGNNTISMSTQLYLPMVVRDWSPPEIVGLRNAYRWHADANQATYSAIVTGDPTLRNANGEWSYMRVGSQKIIGTDIYYVEIGWNKSADSQSNFYPRVYWTYRATDGSVSEGWDAYPGIAIGYNYQVQWIGGNTWAFYFNDLNNPIIANSVGWNVSDRFFSGGETPNIYQGMGDSENNNVQYMSEIGIWYAACPTYTYITDDIYRIDDGVNCSSWRVYGNN